MVFTRPTEIQTRSQIIPTNTKIANERQPILTLIGKTKAVQMPAQSTPSPDEMVQNSTDMPIKYQISLGCSIAALAIGVGGFLVTVLSKQALMFLFLSVFAFYGMLYSLVSSLLHHGLIAYYSPMIQRILTERTMVEFILEGTIVKEIMLKIKEIYPIFFCKTPEDRLEALANMSDGARKWMTTKGLINLMPSWVQHITLSTVEFHRQKDRLANDETGFRPAPDVVKYNVNAKPLQDRLERVEVQMALAKRLFFRNQTDKMADWLMKKVDPKTCRNAALALIVLVLVQFRLSSSLRTRTQFYVRNRIFAGSISAAVLFSILTYMRLQAGQRFKK